MDEWLLLNSTSVLVQCVNSTCADNASFNDELPKESLYEQPILMEFRVAVLWICAVFGFIGNGLVLVWVGAHRTRRSRIILLILHLTLSDLLVLGCATLPQIVWEYAERVWTAGDFVCRLVKFLQTFSITVSNYMVVALAIDRYYAIRRPLKKPLQVVHIAGGAWVIAALVNFSNFFLFRVVEYKGQLNCRSVLYDLPDKTYFKAYMTVVSLLIFFLPLFVICTCYIRIFQKIAQKAAEGKKSKRSSIKPGKVHLQATPSSSLPRAKIKTLKMTVVIVLSFLVCSGPYFICEMWRFYGNQTLSAELYSVLGALAVSNSSSNPFVFLAFNSGWRWWAVFCYRNRSSANLPTASTNTEQTTKDSMRVNNDSALPNDRHMIILHTRNGHKFEPSSSIVNSHSSLLTSL